jgi:ketosteroid isomerase-like protein
MLLASNPHMSRRRISVVLSILSFSLCVATVHADARAQHRKEVRKQIEQLESQWREAAVKNDIATLDRLLSDDFIGINDGGTLQTKQQLLAARAAGKVKFDKIDYSDTKIRVYGDTAVVTTTADVVGHSETSGDLSGKYRYTRVYTRHNKEGTWRIVSFENSRVRQDH